MYYGVDAFWNDVASYAQRNDIETGAVSKASTRYPNGGSQFYSGAFYGNYQWHLGPKLILNTGLRYSLVRLKAENLDEDIAQVERENGTVSNANLLETIDLTNQALTGSVSLVLSPTHQTKISGILSSGFRAPNVDDVGKVFEVDGDAIVVPNSDLQPEYSYNQEIGIEQHFSQRLRLKLVAYHSFLVDAIVRDETEFNGVSNLSFDGNSLSLRSQVNSRSARLYGGSAMVHWNFGDRWSLVSSLSMNEGKETDTNQPLRHATPIFGRSAVTYETGNFRSEFFIDYHGSRGLEDIPDSEILDKPYLYTEAGSPAWSTLNFRFGYSPSKNLSVESGLENLLDKHYRTYSSGISAPGRNVYVTVRGYL